MNPAIIVLSPTLTALISLAMLCFDSISRPVRDSLDFLSFTSGSVWISGVVNETRFVESDSRLDSVEDLRLFFSDLSTISVEGGKEDWRLMADLFSVGSLGGGVDDLRLVVDLFSATGGVEDLRLMVDFSALSMGIGVEDLRLVADLFSVASATGGVEDLRKESFLDSFKSPPHARYGLVKGAIRVTLH